MAIDIAEKETQQKGKRKIAIAVAVAAVVIAAIAAFFLLAPHDTEGSSIKDGNGVSQAQLDDEAMKSRLWVSVATSISCDSGTGTCYATDKDGNAITVLDNREENTRGIVYSMALEDGTVIYESGLIEPGEGIESPKLTEHLDPGTYNVVVTAQGHDVESHKAVGGTVSAQTTLVVK